LRGKKSDFDGDSIPSDDSENTSGSARDPVLLERIGSVAVVTLNRPEALNAFSPKLMVMLATLWRKLRDDDEVKVIVVTGSGPRAFSAGADLKLYVPLRAGHRAPQDEWDEKILRMPELENVALLKTFDINKPVIAAINGLAVGGGVELILGTDIRVISQDATLHLKEVRWGLFPAGGSTVHLPRQFPYALAMEMLLTGREITAQQAFVHGLVNQCVPSEEVIPSAMILAQEIAGLSRHSVQAIRRSVRATYGQPTDEALALEAEIAKSVFSTAEAKQGLQKFSED